MSAIIGLVFPEKEKKKPAKNTGTVITAKTGKKQPEKTAEDREMERKEAAEEK